MSKVIASVLTLGVTLPIWYYLLYKVLEMVGASEVMWLLYWVYMPVGIVAHLLFKLSEGK